MKTKTIVAACLMSAAVFTKCSGDQKQNNQEAILQTVPEELTDTTVIINDQENALDKLNAVIDSTSK